MGDKATINSNYRPITVEVKQGNPLTLPQNNVDNTLLNKLFPNKRKYTPRTTKQTLPQQQQQPESLSEPVPQNCVEPVRNTPAVKKPRLQSKIDENLMNALGLPCRPQPEEETTTSSGTPSPQSILSPRLKSLPTIRDALIYLQSNQSEIDGLKKDALRASIEKDRAMAIYYKKKVELLERLFEKNNS